MDQIERIMRMMEEFSGNLKKQFGDYVVDVEHEMGRKKVVLTNTDDDRFIMGFNFSENNFGLVATPEVEEEEIGITQLERELLDAAGRRAIYNLQSRFSERTDWELSSLNAIFSKGDGRIILDYNEGELSITEGDVEYTEEDS